MPDNEIPSYYNLVYAVVRCVPHGRVTTYGAIAGFLGLGASRMVGWALNRLFSGAYDVPAHRVVNRKGELSGRHHFVPQGQMQALLESEGIRVADDQVQDFKQVFWDPSAALGDDWDYPGLTPNV
jgi:methylated-DNA-protein-cysteine methyltransferase related protein